MFTSKYTYFTDSELVESVWTDFNEKLSSLLSMSQQMTFNTLSLVKLDEIREFTNNEEYLEDLEQLTEKMNEILEYFNKSSQDLFPIHFSEQYNERYINFSSNELDSDNELLLQCLNANSFDDIIDEIDADDIVHTERKPTNFEWAAYHDYIEQYLLDHEIEATFSHLGSESHYLEFYYEFSDLDKLKNKAEKIAAENDLSKIIVRLSNDNMQYIINNHSFDHYVDANEYLDALND